MHGPPIPPTRKPPRMGNHPLPCSYIYITFVFIILFLFYILVSFSISQNQETTRKPPPMGNHHLPYSSIYITFVFIILFLFYILVFSLLAGIRKGSVHSPPLNIPPDLFYIYKNDIVGVKVTINSVFVVMILWEVKYEILYCYFVILLHCGAFMLRNNFNFYDNTRVVLKISIPVKLCL